MPGHRFAGLSGDAMSRILSGQPGSGCQEGLPALHGLLGEPVYAGSGSHTSYSQQGHVPPPGSRVSGHGGSEYAKVVSVVGLSNFFFLLMLLGIGVISDDCSHLYEYL